MIDPAQSLMQKLFDEAKTSTQAFDKRLGFEKKIEIFELDDKLQKVGSRKSEMVIKTSHKNGKKIEEIIEKNDRPAKGKPEDDSLPDLNEALAARFEYSLHDKLEFENGNINIVVDFNPKPNPPRHENQDDVINNISGTMRVDLENHYIKTINGHLNHRVSWYLRAFGIHQLEITAEQDKRPDLENLVVVRSFMVKVHYTLFSIDYYEQRVYTYSNYSLNPPE